MSGALMTEEMVAAYLNAHGIAATVRYVWNEDADGEVQLPPHGGYDVRVQVGLDYFMLNKFEGEGDDEHHVSLLLFSGEWATMERLVEKLKELYGT